MKLNRKTILICLLSTPILVFGQQGGNHLSGKITYEEKIKLEIKIEGEGAQFASMLPKERTSEKILSFSPDATLFEEGNSNTEDMMAASGNPEGGVRIRMVGSAENKIYTDLKTGTVTDRRDFMNRIFLVEKPVPATDWKITGNQKQVLGFNCIEAYSTDTAGVRTTVWFASSIPVKGGPAGLGNLPGMILEADINNGSRIYRAKNFEPVGIKELKIEKPKDGKKVSEAEYKQIQEEKMKEMGVESGSAGSGANVHIIIRK